MKKLEIIERVDSVWEIICNESDVAQRCPEYDDTCHNMHDCFKCWLGGTWICSNTGEKYHFDRANGYCPLIHNEN